MSYQKKGKRGHARLPFFCYDNDSGHSGPFHVTPPRCLDYLLHHGAETDITDKQQNPSLIIATLRHHYDVMITLIYYNCDVNQTDAKCNTAAHVAVQQNDMDAVHILYNVGANLELSCVQQDHRLTSRRGVHLFRYFLS